MREPYFRVFRILALAASLAASSIPITSSLALGAERRPVSAVATSAPVAKAASDDGKPSDIVINSMQKELDRSFSKLKNIASAPLYFMSYSL